MGGERGQSFVFRQSGHIATILQQIFWYCNNITTKYFNIQQKALRAIHPLFHHHNDHHVPLSYAIANRNDRGYCAIVHVLNMNGKGYCNIAMIASSSLSINSIIIFMIMFLSYAIAHRNDVGYCGGIIGSRAIAKTLLMSPTTHTQCLHLHFHHHHHH